MKRETFFCNNIFKEKWCSASYNVGYIRSPVTIGIAMNRAQNVWLYSGRFVGNVCHWCVNKDGLQTVMRTWKVIHSCHLRFEIVFVHKHQKFEAQR